MNEFEEIDSQPQVQNTTVAPTVVDSHKENVYQHITDRLTKHFEAIANKKYDTKVTVTSADAPMTMNVNIRTNDPMIIAALAAGA